MSIPLVLALEEAINDRCCCLHAAGLHNGADVMDACLAAPLNESEKNHMKEFVQNLATPEELRVP